MEMHGGIKDGNRPRKATSKLTIWLASSFALLMLYLTITTALNVREITKLSGQLRALRVNVTTLENDNHGHAESTDRLDKRDDVNVTAPGLQLVPHPIYYNVQTMPIVYPNTTAVSTRSEHKKRIAQLWWVLGGVCKCRSGDLITCYFLH